MNSILFTYYSDLVKDIFVDNIQSLLDNTDQEYTTLLICSQTDIPTSFIKRLYNTRLTNIIRVFPEANAKSSKILIENRVPLINPYLFTALSYLASASLITVFDSQLFIINRIDTTPNTNIFYCDHRGVINPGLFTLINNSEAAKLLTVSLMNIDFSDLLALNRFAFIVSNGTAFNPKNIVGDKFILSNPNTNLKLIPDKLIALDMRNTVTHNSIHTEMWDYRKKLVEQTNPIDLIMPKPKIITTLARVISGKKEAKILYKYASRSRPDLFYRGLISIFNNSISQNFVVLVTLDENDPTIEKYKKMINDFPTNQLVVIIGQSKNKIDAINRDLDKFTEPWDILVNMSDDMVFTKYGFDNTIRSGFLTYFPKGDGFLHFHDNCQNRLATMSIIDKKYFNRFGYIYHSDYVSVYCDNEAQDVAKILSRYAYMGDSIRILEHLHPLHNPMIKMDSQYVHTESFYSQDEATYNRRKKINFEL